MHRGIVKERTWRSSARASSKQDMGARNIIASTESKYGYHAERWMGKSRCENLSNSELQTMISAYGRSRPAHIVHNPFRACQSTYRAVRNLSDALSMMLTMIDREPVLLYAYRTESSSDNVLVCWYIISCRYPSSIMQEAECRKQVG